MIIPKDVRKFIVHRQTSMRDSLAKLRRENTKIIFAVDEENRIEGLLTLGDMLRWVLSQEVVDLNVPICNVANKNFLYVHAGQEKSELPLILAKKDIHTVPIVDGQMKLLAVACTGDLDIVIGDHLINDSSPAFLIAEIGNNHNGSYELARLLIDEAARAGADCAKFQLRDMKSLYCNNGNCNDPTADLGTQYTLDILTKYQLKTDDMLRLFDYCRVKGLEPLCTPWDEASVEVLEKYGMSAFKVASPDLTNHDLLRKIAATHRPMLCSTGMSTEPEIKDGIRVLKEEGGQFVLLHCNSTYPTPLKDVNLRYMTRLRELGNCPIGYSGHERGYVVPVAAISLGAKVIEKHFTLDRNMEGNDHKVSLLPDEFAAMVTAIRNVEEAMGGDPVGGREISQGELINRENLAKSLVVRRNISKGEVITEDMIAIRSPGKGLPPYSKSKLVGSNARRDMQANDFFYLSDLEVGAPKARDYNFSFSWGVPVRFHDWKKLSHRSNMNLVEFHLSYKDIELCVGDYFDVSSDLNFIVHSPELFAGDHILDLCSPDEAYREHSIKELQRVIGLTLEMNKFFPKTVRPRIITNIGGFSDNSFVDVKRRQQMLDNFIRSFEQLRSDDYEILPQTMPPFPWHFGGQRFHNVLVKAQEIATLCKREGLNICLDVSHSQLACNYFKSFMSEFVSTVAPYTSHMHLADADGLDGEGLQIGEGSVDFYQISSILRSKASDASFIPEIWQGHKNDGEGFWQALERLECYF